MCFMDTLNSGMYMIRPKIQESRVSLILSLVGSPYIFLNLINQARGRIMMEMYYGFLVFISSNHILLQLMLQISLTIQASSFLNIFCQLLAYSANVRGFLSPDTTCLFQLAITISFPRSGYFIRSTVQPSCLFSICFLKFQISLYASSTS